MAIREMLVFLNEGYEWIVDIDLEKFFDNVPQDKLMSLVHNIINDGDTESLIRKYLKAGVMIQGRYEKTEKGTPQGGNLSPLLSNVMLNELDKELGKTDIIHGRPLSMDSEENMCGQSNHKRKAVTGRACKLL